MKRKFGSIEIIFVVIIIAVIAVFGCKKLSCMYTANESVDKLNENVSAAEEVTAVVEGQEQKVEEDCYSVEIWKYSYEILEVEILKELPFEPAEHASGIKFEGNKIVNDYSIVSVTITATNNNEMNPEGETTLNNHQLHINKGQDQKEHKYQLYMCSLGEDPDSMSYFHYNVPFGETSEPMTMYFLVSDDDLAEDANIYLLLNPMGAYGSKTVYKVLGEEVTTESTKKYALINLNNLLKKDEGN